MKGPSFCENIAAVPKRIALADCPVIGRVVLARSIIADPERVWIPGRTTPEIGLPVDVLGLEL